jgi:uncharacterized membrane protein
MAGIGFRMQRLMAEPTFHGLLRAYLYAAIIGSGPLVMSITALGLLSVVVSAPGFAERSLVFYASVTYVYAFTMILTGPLQLVFVRFAADSDYAARTGRALPFLLNLMAATVPVLWVLGALFFFLAVEESSRFEMGSTWLAAMVGAIWLAASYLTAAKNYHQVLASFAIGYAASFGLAWAAAEFWGADAVMIGFAAGHALLLLALMACLTREISLAPGDLPLPPGSMRQAFVRYWDLALCGFLYNTGVWIDKMLFWWIGPGRIEISGWLYAMPIHDKAVYLGFLSIIPGMAIFLLRFETEFARHYEAYFRRVIGKATLGELEAIRRDMVAALNSEILLLIKVQGSVTLVLFFNARQVMPYFGLGSLQIGVFQMVLLGSLLLVLFLSYLTVLFYLDKRKEALAACALFCIANAAITYATLRVGEAFYGLGFVLAAGLALATAAYLAEQRLRRLHYDTFVLQPLYPPEIEEPAR